MIERLIQQAILQILTPIFDPGFSESSFGFRPKRSAQDAATQVQRYIRLGYRQCVDMDLAKFFDSIPHDQLLAQLQTKIADGRVLSLIKSFLQAGILDGGDEWTPALKWSVMPMILWCCVVRAKPQLRL